ncbi:MAG: biotin--[acetyl-CoA-carboxylase] ligase [Odoribacteraceae bacterium]|jgi:BirA family biotin operon repressor/biotin-[acetyl-CoA-carboxylase] ligase|nr:biotin--[acetyl-CoA-carboxylase] ligase [Odoribacteraceae bacterium]
MYQLNGFEIWEYPELSSTNDEAARRAGELPDRGVVVARRQTGGRGQGGNQWESEAGKNITMTIAFRPRQLPARDQFAISMAVALGTRDLVARYASGCSVKWPNDVYVDDRKIAGILIEHVVTGEALTLSLCGVGLNVNQTRFTSDAPNPVSLSLILGRELPTREVMEGLLDAIDRRYRLINDPSTLRRDYLASLYRGTGTSEWEDDKGRFMAIVEGVNGYGQLLLRDEEGRTRVYNFKEVRCPRVDNG